MELINWGGNYRFGARRLHQPADLEELRAIVTAVPQLRVVGSLHSFTDIADAPALLGLDRLPEELSVDATARTATVSAGVRYGELAVRLAAEGLALHNLASLPHISVAGAVSTATHGSGQANGNLATAVAALELMTSSGELLRLERGDADFAGAVVGLGALGVLTRLTVDLEPAYEVSQHVYEGLSWESLLAHLDEIMASAYSVSVFTRWGAEAGRVWLKARLDAPGGPPAGELFGARAARSEQHPIEGLDPVHCTPQLGRPGPWLERLPHFRMGFTPSSGEEIQSEYHLPRAGAGEAIRALLELAPRLRPLTQVAEIRAVAADELWMSPQYRRETIAVHFTWAPRQAEVERALGEVEAALLPLGARPHWGKLFVAGAEAIGPAYERREDFARLVARLDPRGAFTNAWLRQRVLGRE